VVGKGPFSLCGIHKEGLCPSSGDINKLVIYIHTYLQLTLYLRRGSRERQREGAGVVECKVKIRFSMLESILLEKVTK
jgi:hypothetical protein